jgi:phage shock protein PspC (stress-responsive transcriptional regulator)
MKKTISINIAGVVFNIEEDCYDLLRNYLTSIQKYFANYEGSQDIIQDIEGRIAEKFSDGLQKANKQAIEQADVDAVIASMGTVTDFEAIVEDEDLASSQIKDNAPSVDETPTPTAKPANNRIFRDLNRKLLGGVCAGLAHYMNTDPLWVRLVTLVLFFGLVPANGIGGAILLIYIAFWVAFPGSSILEEDPKLKKLFRDPDHKVLGGVIGGIAKYTGWDLGVLRFVFVMSILAFGTGLLLYVILWTITPEARTLTDKMQMTGEPITLENIESNIKRSIDAINKPEEPLTKILLFPFRALSAIFTALTPLFQFTGSAARIFAGLIMLFIGTVASFGILVAMFSVLGILGTFPVQLGHFPAYLLAGDIHPVMITFAFLAAVTPFVAIALVGIMLITKRKIFTSVVWQTMLGLFLAGILGSAISVGKYFQNFSKRGIVEKTLTYPLVGKTPLLRLDRDKGMENFFVTDFNVEGYEGADIMVEQRFSAMGKTKEEAQKNAQSIIYQIVQKDSIFLFDENIDLATNVRFRDQRLKVNVKIPYEKTVYLSEGIAGNIHNFNWDRINWKESGEVKYAPFKFTKDGKWICLDEKALDPNEITSDNNEDDNEDGFMMGQGEYKKTFDQKDFSQLEIDGSFYVEVRKGDGHKIMVDGNKKDVEDVKVEVSNGILVVKHRNTFNWIGRNEKINVRITMPSLSAVNLTGATKAIVKGFNDTRKLKIEVSGASVGTFTSLNADKLEVEMSGASKLHLVGKCNDLQADISGASKMRAMSLDATKVELDASGASKASVSASRQLDITATGASHVSYKGSATLHENTSGAASVEQSEDDNE